MAPTDLRPPLLDTGDGLGMGNGFAARLDPDSLANGSHRQGGGAAAALPADVRAHLGVLVYSLGDEREAEVVDAARGITSALEEAGFDLSALAAVIASPPEPILIPPAKSGRARRGEPMSVRTKLAEKLTRLVVNPRVDLTKWELDFVDSVVPGLRADLPLSDKQANVVDRLLKKPRRRLP